MAPGHPRPAGPLSFKTASLSFLIISVCCLTPVTRTSVQTHTFKTVSGCSGQGLNPSLHFHNQSARSSLECSVRCSTQPGCVSAEFDATSKLCYLSTQTAEMDCSNMEMATGVKHFEKIIPLLCLNGGTEDDTGNCTCTDLYCGPKCEQVVQDCQDSKNCKGLTFTKATPMYIWPSTSPSPFQALCQEMAGDRVRFRTYLAYRKLSTVDFNRTWDEYRNGFGDLSDGNHWLGLDKLHYLTTNRAYDFRLTFKLQNGSQYTGVYPNFVVANETNGYSFLMSTPSNGSNKVQDCLSSVEGARFSTYDKDNDGSVSVSCAQLHGGGFWYSGDNCTSVCSPFGPLLQPANDAVSVTGEAFFTLAKYGRFSPNVVLAYLVNV